MEKKTTVQVDTARMKAFRDAAKSQGFDWRYKLNEVIDRFAKEYEQSKVKGMTRKAKGAL